MALRVAQEQPLSPGASTTRERVLQHALMNVCEPLFDKWLVFDTYASRKGKGQFAAVQRVRQFAGRHAWFLKCDFRKYFDSIPHEGIRRMLRRKFKDVRLLSWFDRILGSYETASDRGLPIGNLTSQHFANLYLDPLDRLFHPYVRYMDDFVFWGDDKASLLRIRDGVRAFVRDTLSLELKGEPFLNRTSHGMDFLGGKTPRTPRTPRETNTSGLADSLALRALRVIQPADWPDANGVFGEPKRLAMGTACRPRPNESGSVPVFKTIETMSG